MGYKEAGCSKRFAAEIYTELILASAQYLFVFFDEYDIAQGFSGLSSKFLEEEMVFQKNKKYFSKIFEEKINSELIKDKKSLKEYYESEEYIENKQTEISNNYLEILILDDSLRGTGTGFQLFNVILNILSELEKENNYPGYFTELSIYTTEKCSYQFYEHIGYKLIVNYNSNNVDNDIKINKFYYVSSSRKLSEEN